MGRFPILAVLNHARYPSLTDHPQGRGFTSSPLLISMISMQRPFSLSAGIIPVFSLFLALLWFAYEMVFEAKVPFFRDLGPYFYPIRFSLAESFKEGEFPLWDRHMAMGFPLLADFQSGTFYPPHLMMLFLPFFDAIRALF